MEKLGKAMAAACISIMHLHGIKPKKGKSLYECAMPAAEKALGLKAVDITPKAFIKANIVAIQQHIAEHKAQIRLIKSRKAGAGQFGSGGINLTYAPLQKQS